MKKFIFLMLTAVLFCMTAGLSSCNSCGKVENNAVQADYDGVLHDFTAGVSNIQALHRQMMYAQVSHDYQWRNSKVLFDCAICSANLDDIAVVDVTDVFQYWDNSGPKVQFISSNVLNGTIIPPAIPDVWIEDASLNEAQIKLSAEDVLQLLKEWNGVIPVAECMSLRLPVGPVACNAQWVIGDVYDVIFVDAVTGEISNVNPAFKPNNNESGGDTGEPLGEWP